MDDDTGTHRPLWVFGYGSLIWSPGIDVAQTVPARLDGYRRRFCMWSIHHRGSEAEPGLVLALEPADGAGCEGLALRAADPEAALRALRERELISSAYREQRVVLQVAGGTIDAIAYVIDTAHGQYAPDLDLDEQARIITRSSGGKGPNRDYLHNTAAALDREGIVDPDIARLSRMVPVGS